MMSTAHFSRRFREAYSETPYSYLMTRRIERAKALLRRGDLTVTDVCFAVGWRSLGSFSARFTELVGESPSAYRARNHDELRSCPPARRWSDPSSPGRGPAARGREQFRRSIRHTRRSRVGGMTVSLSTVHISVDDPDAALAFYRDTLGLTVRSRSPTRASVGSPSCPTASPKSGSCCRSPRGAAPRRTGTPWRPCWPRGDVPVHFRTRRPRRDLRQDRHHPRRRGAAGARQPALGRATPPCATPPATVSGSSRRRRSDPLTPFGAGPDPSG